MIAAAILLAAAIALPPTTGAADYQLGGAYTPPSGVTVVTRDSDSRPAKGVYSICYVNGFQTQPADRKWWLSKHKNLVLFRAGKPTIDPNWPDELMLDTSTSAKRAAIAKVIGRTITSCADKGFAAVEIDNLDSYTRSHRALSASDNRAMATLYAEAAHERGMAIGQKNAAEQTKKLRPIFDFAVAEECYRFNECSSYTRYYGTHVIDIEYTDDLRGTFADACSAKGRPMTILRDRNLVPKGDSDYVYRSC